VSNRRVFGTFLDADGLRHDISGVIDGVFSKKPGGWDSYTHCGMYSTSEPDTDPKHYVTCLKCIGTVRRFSTRVNEDGSIDEAADIDVERFVASMAALKKEREGTP
jgi:hypothetical protein